MKELTKKELIDVKGGGVSAGTVLLITGALVFVIGVIDGYLRPLKCH